MVKFLISGLVALACIAGLAAASVGFFLLTTPRPTNLKDCITTEMFKVNLCPTAPGYTKLGNISPNLRNAIIVSEDGAFYSHKGFDWTELQESFNKNMETGGFARGGSTITQQLAKNVYLTGEKSILRKLREALITVQIEDQYSKDEILEKYLNVVEFGPKLYGIGPASRRYFGKSPSQLNVSESAFLAFLLPSPEKYSVSFAKKRLTPFARSQMRQIVGRLLRYKKISEDDHVIALAQIDTFFGAPADTTPVGDDVAPSDEEMGFESESPTAQTVDESPEAPDENSEVAPDPIEDPEPITE